MAELKRSDDRQYKEIDEVINHLLAGVYPLQGKYDQQIVMSAVLQFTAFMLLNATDGNKDTAKHAWVISGDPIIRKYIDDAEQWIARFASMTDRQRLN